MILTELNQALKLYVDDIRDPKGQGWTIARNYDEAIHELSTKEYDTLSLDHDIASYREDGREMTGYDIALWLAERNHNGEHTPPNIFIHSANPVGEKNIQAVIDRYLR